MTSKLRCSITYLIFTLFALLCSQLSAQTDARFQRFDKNNDGKISREETKGTAAEQRLDFFDKNKDGFITPDEMPRPREGALSHGAFFNTHGWIYISVNYRLSPAVAHPTHCEDVAKALAFTARHVAEWGGDAKRLHLSGHSAGAHLASLVALNDRFLKAEGLSPAMVRAVVLLDTAA